MVHDRFPIETGTGVPHFQTKPSFVRRGFEGFPLPQTSRVDFGMQTELVETDARRHVM